MVGQVSEVEPQQMSWTEFLETTPPGRNALVEDAFERIHPDSPDRVLLCKPDIQLYCGSELCGGVRAFACISENLRINRNTKSPTQIFINYMCRNCNKRAKIFAVVIIFPPNNPEAGYVLKLGEMPPFGSRTSSRVISLIGPDREVFLRGRRAENQGLGLGAYAYYRRVVENQKGRLIREIAKVAERLGASPEVLSVFEKAANETQFSRAVEDLSTAIPQPLLIHGHNPLSLLHRALNGGLHDSTDEHCLELAISIRVILTELAERISQVLKDEAELKQVVSKLLKSQEASSEEQRQGSDDGDSD